MTLAAVAHTGVPSRLSRIIALDPGDLGLRDLEHLARALASLLAGARDVSTHVVAEPWPHECAVIAIDEIDGQLPNADVASLAETVWRLAANLGASDPGVVVWAVGTGVTTFAGDPVRAIGALGALVARRNRTGGRAIDFAGQEQLTGTRTIREVLALTDIEAIDSLGIPVDPETPVVTRDFVRPTFRAGQLVLALRPRAEGMGCFEQPDPTPCCAMH
jgi:hypothetical protein